MRVALKHIEEKRKDFSTLPFFGYLRDRTLTPERRFTFTPAVAPFVMAFADLNKYSLRIADPKQPLERLINRHSEEDATHFEMYLEDLAALGFDLPARLSDTLRFLWADERKYCRQTCYKLSSMLTSAPLPLRVVIVEAVESAGAAAFETLSELALEYATATGRELQFFGLRHKVLETGHALGTDGVEERLHSLVLSEQERAQAKALVDQVFQIFTVMMQELHEFGLAASAEESTRGRGACQLERPRH